MLAKLGHVTAGVVVGLVALAPAATATEDHEHHSDDDGRTCTTTGGDAAADSTITGETVAAAVSQAPIAGSPTGNIACSDVLSNNDDNVSHNFNGNY